MSSALSLLGTLTLTAFSTTRQNGFLGKDEGFGAKQISLPCATAAESWAGGSSHMSTIQDQIEPIKWFSSRQTLAKLFNSCSISSSYCLTFSLVLTSIAIGRSWLGAEGKLQRALNTSHAWVEQSTRATDVFLAAHAGSGLPVAVVL